MRNTTTSPASAPASAPAPAPSTAGPLGLPSLTARSVIASTLLGADPPELAVSYLVHVAGLFSINENRARVALSRMVRNEEVTTDGSGRYRLAGHLLERQARQSASRAGQTRPWQGDWHIVVVTAGASSAGERSARRLALARAHLAELRDGAWVRPANLELRLPAPQRDDVVAFVGQPEPGPPDLVSWSGELFRLDDWAKRARQLSGAMSELDPRGPEELAQGFVLSAAVLRHFGADPLLPDALLPRDWPGGALRRQYDEWDAAYRAVLAESSRGGAAASAG